MNYALFLTAYSEVRKVREYATLTEAEQAAVENNNALALIYVPPQSRAYYRAFERVTLDDGSYTWREPVQTDNVVPIRRG